MTKSSSSLNVGTFAALAWGAVITVLCLLMMEAFSMGFRKGLDALTDSLPLLFFFFCVPLLAFAGSLLLAIRMSRGDMRDRPLAIVLLVIGIPWALMQSCGVLVGL